MLDNKGVRIIIDMIYKHPLKYPTPPRSIIINHDRSQKITQDTLHYLTHRKITIMSTKQNPFEVFTTTRGNRYG